MGVGTRTQCILILFFICYTSHPAFPPSLFSLCIWKQKLPAFCCVSFVLLVIYILGSPYSGYCAIKLCVWFISLYIILVRYIHLPSNASSVSSLWLSGTPLCIKTTFSLPVHWFTGWLICRSFSQYSCFKLWYYKHGCSCITVM